MVALDILPRPTPEHSSESCEAGMLTWLTHF